MCKRLGFLISVVFVLGLAGYALAQDAVIPLETPVIDGIKEDAWLLSEEHRIANVTQPPGGESPSGIDFYGSWWALWDPEYFYVFMDINDDELWNDSTQHWQDDSVEILIDIGDEKNPDDPGKGDDDYQYTIPWYIDPNIWDASNNHGARGLVGVEYKLLTKVANDGYTVEIKFPWATLDYLKKGVTLGSELGLEFQMNDDDDGGTTRENQLAWHTVNDAWNNPSLWGTVVLVTSPKACIPNPYDGEEGIREGLLQWSAGIFAASHEVYFDPCEAKVHARSGCDVNGVSRLDPNYPITGLIPETTYYWAIDEVNEAGPAPYFWAGDIWSFTTASLSAHHPDPCDGDQLASIDVDLFWGTGFYSQGHIVYFDPCEAKVQARSGCEVNGVSVVDPCYPLPPLDVNTIYYWTIDEVNETDPDPCFWQGEVWEFKTVPVAKLGSILCEVWRDIGGGAVSNLTSNRRYPYNPDETSYPTWFEDPTVGDYYGSRMHGWLYVWDSDYYTFWISSDDNSELWLSSDDNPEHVEMIASVPTYNAVWRIWDEFPEQQSAPIHLVARELYYIMALHKEDNGSDHMAVAWGTTTDPNTAEVIEGKRYLVPYEQRTSFNANPPDGAFNVESKPTLNWKLGMYADKHDVYFGTDFNSVNDADNSDPMGPNEVYKIRQDANSYTVTGLIPSTTYYWRIDEVNEAGPDPCLWKGDVWCFTTAPVTAHSPHPTNDAQWIYVDSDISWGAGFYARTHNVYFGTDPEPPLVQTGWLTTTYEPGTLQAGTTYYWAIDEVNETGPDPCLWQGEVWSFTTALPASAQDQFAITYYDNYNYDSRQWDAWLVAWEDYNTPLYIWNDEYLADLTSGKTEATSHYFTSINELDLRGGFTSLDEHPYGPYDEDWNPLKSIGDDVSGQSPHHVFAAIFTGWVYFEEGDILSLTSDDDSYIFLDDNTDWGEEILSIPHGSGFEQVDLLIPAELAGYHWMTVKFADRFDYQSGIQIILNGQPLQATPLSSSKPSPVNNAIDVVSDPTLSWSPGKYAVTHDVYFGTDEAAVTDANRTSDPCGVLVEQDHDSNSIDIADFVGTLEFDTTYYWRIDDINMAGPDPCIWKGPVWSFTTASYQVMDDFEGYTDLTIGDVWHSSDGSYVTTSTDVNGQVHSGDEAMAIGYDNASPPYYSEVYTGADTGGLSSLDFGSDWFPKGVKILSLWFHGIEDLRGSYTGTDPYTLTGDGSGIIGTSDSFYYLYRQANQITGRVQARVDSVECGMAGVMIRDDLNPDSVYAATVVTPDNRVIFMGRGNAGGNSSAIATISGIAIPHWVRIKRSGTPAMIVAEHSSDGSTWLQIGPSLPWPITSPIYLGLCVTSNSYGDMCTAGFSNVEMQCPVGTVIADPDTGIDIGIPYNDPEPMYVGLEDNNGHSAFVSYPDPDATQIGVWMRWLINLNDFTDVNLADVKRMYIGFGDRGNPAQGGSGTVFIDDIRLLALCFPECHPDYDEWVNVGKPDCWCYKRQCYGDADNVAEGSTKTGYHYVHFNDLTLLQSGWNIKEPPKGPGVAWPNPCICADFAHDKEGSTKTGYYRVHFNDLAILLANWNIKEPPDGPGIEPDCLDCL